MPTIHTTTTSSGTVHDDVYELMRNIRKENPGLNQRKTILKWRSIVRDYPEMTNSALALAGLFVYNAVLPKPKKRRDKTTKELSRKHIARFIFSFTMPNGKPLGDCTFGEVGKFGEGFAQLAKMGKPNEVICKKLTQAEARKAVLG